MLMETIDELCTDKDVDAMMKQGDTDGDGKINYQGELTNRLSIIIDIDYYG